MTIDPAERRASRKRRIMNAMIHLRPECATVQWISRLAMLGTGTVRALLGEMEQAGELERRRMHTPDGADDVYTFRKAA